MTNETYKILIVDDEELNLKLLSRLLSCDQYILYTAVNGKEAIELAINITPDLVILDVLMPELDGAETCRILKNTELTCQIPVIMLTSHPDKNAKLRCLRAGANDFLEKPVEDIELQLRVSNLLEFKRHAETMRLNEMLQQSKASLEGKNRELEAALKDRFKFQDIITTCPVMKKELELAVRVAASPLTTVVIYGESGCGKEVLSRAIHVEGGGRPGFVAVNCAAIPEALLESELFGHVRGAFTGADREREGKFSQAQGGTLLLDEIGDMPLGLQAKLLRVLEERTFEKVGSNETIPVNCRVIVATNRNLPEMIAAGRFREDLFHRINIFPITIPPLRERRDDILLLVDHFLGVFRQHQGKSLPGISQKALDELIAYRWPGNIRELRNCLERAAIVCDGLIQPEHLCICTSGGTGSVGTNTETDLPAGGAIAYHFAFKPDMISMEAVTRRVLDITLEWCKGNKSQAASLLNVSRNKFYR
ncbi:MAG: sigma-54 dependent transcriptional regulator [Desulfuromonadaceae bacterium]